MPVNYSEISAERYAALFPEPATAFDKAAFIGLNADKAECIRIVAATDGDSDKPVMAQAFGLRGGVWRAPFSAPFSAGAGGDERLWREFYDGLADFLGGAVRVAWPSECYGIGPAPAPYAVAEHNFHYPLEQAADYEKHLSRSARYNHNRCMRLPFTFERVDEPERAYRIIEQNRKAMGYPLAMSLQQVKDTRRIIAADYFVLSLEGEEVASAIVFRPVRGVAELIYWGDLPHARKWRPMNRLAWEVVSYYGRQDGIHTLDIGPASTDGVINQGLADFKLSIGCVDTPRPIITLTAR